MQTQTNSKSFVLCEHFNGLQGFAWLSQADMYRDQWDDTRVDLFEDRDGEMIPHDVRISDLDVLEVV